MSETKTPRKTPPKLGEWWWCDQCCSDAMSKHTMKDHLFEVHSIHISGLTAQQRILSHSDAGKIHTNTYEVIIETGVRPLVLKKTVTFEKKDAAMEPWEL